jgi:hypothetical protein
MMHARVVLLLLKKIEKNVADYLYSEDALLDDHENEFQEQGYCEDE